MADFTEKSTFSKLVSSLSDNERKSLLEKMHTLSGDPETQELSCKEKIVEEKIPFDELIQKESLFYRIILWFRAIFTNSAQEFIYNKDKILELFKSVDRNYPGLIDYQNGTLQNVFYKKICELKDAVNFFKPYLEIVYDDLGAYYVLLGSMMIPEVTTLMDEKVDPYELPFSREVTSELRSSYLRKLDEIIRNIPQPKRTEIYSCARIVEWFYQLSKLPFDRLKNSFVLSDSAEYYCNFSVVANELNNFARILCHGEAVLEEVLTSLYLFSVNKFVPADSEATDDESRMKEFMNKATANISIIHVFIKTVPIKNICKIVYNDLFWTPSDFSGAEDWFVKYQNHWKKLFDDKWNSWLKEKKKLEVEDLLKSVFELEKLPLLQNRPWLLLWNGIGFKFEHTLGFISWFMQKKYDEVVKPLRQLLIEGDFENKKNRDEFAGALDYFVQVYNDILKLDQDLSSKGSIGLIFDKISVNKIRTFEAQSKVESVMINLEVQSQSIKQIFCDSCRTVSKVLTAAFGNHEDKNYYGVSNLNMIHSTSSVSFNESLYNSFEVFSKALDMIKELESIDSKK